MSRPSQSSKKKLKEESTKKKPAKQPDPFYDPNKELRPTCTFCNEPPQKPPLFNRKKLPFTTSTTSASWEGGACCIRVREIDVNVIPPDESGEIVDSVAVRWPKKRKWVYKTPSDLERVRERDYQYTLKRTLEDEKWERRLGFQRLKQGKRKLLEGVGPAWYQELSYKQMECMDLLGGAIAADVEEGLISRTQHLLARLGVLPRPTNEKVTKAMMKCHLNPIIFLIYLFKYTTLVEDECLEPDSPFSINDRLLLSGLAHLALPITLFDLQCRLPAPPLKRIKKHKAKPNVTREAFTSPYLEPQPICLYNSLIDKDIERKRMQIAKKGGLLKEDEYPTETESDEDFVQITPMESIETNSSSTMSRRTAPRFTVDIKKSMMGKPSTFSVAMFESAMRQVVGGPSSEGSSSGCALPERDRKSAYFQNQLDTRISVGTKERLEHIYSKDQAQFDRDWTECDEEREIRSQIPEHENSTRVQMADHNEVVRFGTDKDLDEEEELFDKKDLQLQKKSVANIDKHKAENKWVIPEIIITYAPDEPAIDYDDYPYVHDDSYKYQYKKPQNETCSLTQTEGSQDEKLQELVCDCARARAAKERKQSVPLPKTPSAESNGLYFTESDILPCPILTIPSLQAAFLGYWSGVSIPSDTFSMDMASLESLLCRAESITNQVEVALEIMAKQGNILAALPQVDTLPAIKRWIRLYKGFKLTPDIKEKLMKKSYRLWGQIQQYPRKVPVPSLHLKNPSKLNWNCKHWLLDKANNMFHKYYSDVRKAQVEDAREYWCSMGMDYFKNPEFRNVYFTYLPSKEEDVLAVRPWDGYNSK